MKASNLLLSIGLIVKNEEKNLPQCLEALKPLRKAIKSELIIVDTGSTDRTVEIAKQYTGRVLSFEWINDFSAARNFGLDAARGEWFLFVDADEWLEDATPLIKLLSHPPEEDFVSLAILNRMFDGTTQRFDPMRMFRRKVGRRFSGAIHETIFQNSPGVACNAILIHNGYEDAEQNYRKSQERNLPMLQGMIERGEASARIYNQLAEEHFQLCQFDKGIDALYAGIELEKQSPNRWDFWSLHHKLVKILSMLGRFDDAIEAAKAYFSRELPIVSSAIDVYYLLAKAYTAKKQYQEVLDNGASYLETRRLVASKQISSADLMAIILMYNNDEDERGIRAMRAFAFQQLGQDEALLEEAKQYDLSRPGQNWNAMADAMFSAACNTGRFEQVEQLYRVLLEDESSGENAMIECREAICEVVDQLCHKRPDCIEGLCGSFSCFISQDPYAKLLSIRKAFYVGTLDDEALTNALTASPTDLRYSELIRYAIEQNLDFSPFTSRIDVDDAAFFTRKLIELWPDFVSGIRAHYPNRPVAESDHALYWEICLCEKALLLSPPDETPIKDVLFERFCRSLGRYTRAIYRAELLEEPSPLLARAHRFGALVGQAYAAKDAGDLIAFLRLLVRAGEAYPLMLAHISREVDAIQASLTPKKADEQERDSLAKQIKAKISEMAYQGQTDTARLLLEQYAKLNPDDPEVAALFSYISSSTPLS